MQLPSNFCVCLYACVPVCVCLSVYLCVCLCLCMSMWYCKRCCQTTTWEEAQALATAPSFQVWLTNRHKDGTQWERNTNIPAPQPAKVLSWLFLGDLDDATHFPTLQTYSISAVLSLCVEHHDPNQELKYKKSGVQFVSIDASDDWSGDYDILANAWPRARQQITIWKAEGRRVLVTCYGGVNRSSAIVVAWLLTEEAYSFRNAMHRVTAVRGTILNNPMFRLQLLRLSREVKVTQ